MSGPRRSQVVEPRASTSKHRTIHSLTTNASGIADSTMSYGTVDALHSQLGHFPPPPSELPTPTTPTSFLIPVPAVHIVPLKLPQRNPHPDVPSETSHGPPQQDHPPIHYPAEEPIPPNDALRPLRRQPSLNTYATGGTVGSLSPFDWHEGSSSIDVDPHDDRMLPTSFITSLISSEHGSPRSNPAPMSPLQNSAQLFSGGNDRDATSSISDATYPPHNYPPTPSPNKVIPPGAAYLESSGRSKSSSVGGITLDTEHGGPSVRSHTPLVIAPHRYEPIEEDTVGELQARGESPKPSSGLNSPWRSFRDRRQSLASTRTTKTYISSLISKLSRVTSRKQTTPKPLPPLPAIPAELRNQEYRKFEESMPLPQLANRAEVLSRMLAKGHTPDSGNPSPSNPYQSMPSTGVGVPWNGVAQAQEAPRSIWSPIYEVSLHQHHSEGEKKATSDRPVGFWERLTTRFGKKRIIMVLLVIAALLLVLAVLLGVLFKKSTSELPTCPAGRTGTDCDISMLIFPSIFLGVTFLAR